MKIAAMSAIAFGILLLVVGSAWTSIFRAESTWTDSKAERLVAVQARIPYLGAQTKRLRPGPDLTKTQDELDALEKEKAELSNEFNSVTKRPSATAKFLRWSGISLGLVGIIGWYAVNQSR